MKLIIDVGNTLFKIALFHENDLIDLRTFDHISAEELNRLIGELENRYSFHPPISHAILSSVRQDQDEIPYLLKSRFTYIELGRNTPVPVKVRYKSPETLGHDRLALAVAAAVLYPATDLLVISAGTCITYDLVNRKNEYLGGSISPGIHMRFKALHTFTGKLPLIKNIAEISLVGETTEQSLLSGVLNGIVAEVDGIIDRYKRDFPGIKVLLTGGDADFFDRKLKNNIFAVSNLLLIGLNMILNYNVQN